jgi:hypothetical protein
MLIYLGNGKKLEVVTDSQLDTVVWVFEAEFCKDSTTANSACVGANDDLSESVLSSRVTFCSEEGREYLVAVGGYGNVEGDFVVEVDSVGECSGIFRTLTVTYGRNSSC